MNRPVQRWSHACCRTRPCLQTFSRSGHSAIERPKRHSHEDGTASRREYQDHVETSQRSSVGSSFKFRSCVLLKFLLSMHRVHYP
ncbi:hypothetical protein E2986_13022 [Frieseomelitta varia]|uniref:Uncharacterized protein n=1 Tax=Frieseomelitta varia TaxID=561572 RepID=A0A833WCQ1_9HYME|nr:hypothetical protein E2986_13022 [Frieseomelitta varia]